MASLGLLVRLVHVLAMAVLVGGAVLVATLARSEAGGWLTAARRYEHAAWWALGLLVATGVGNLGAYGESLALQPARWGVTFPLKLGALLVLLLLSAGRSVLVAQATPAAPRAPLLWAYALTAALSATIAALGVVLAHG